MFRVTVIVVIRHYERANQKMITMSVVFEALRMLFAAAGYFAAAALMSGTVVFLVLALVWGRVKKWS